MKNIFKLLLIYIVGGFNFTASAQQTTSNNTCPSNEQLQQFSTSVEKFVPNALLQQTMSDLNSLQVELKVAHDQLQTCLSKNIAQQLLALGCDYQQQKFDLAKEQLNRTVQMHELRMRVIQNYKESFKLKFINCK
jgi:hypothetical protein